MSAYVVDPETIGKIVTYFEYDNGSNQVTLGRIYDRMAAAGYYLDVPEHVTRLAADLHAMNVDAVCQRYVGDRPESYHFQLARVAWPGHLPALKALRCFLYQCAEGDVPNRPLYKTLDEISNIIAWGIISTLPEYKAAAWG